MRHVCKRDGSLQPVNFSKIHNRILYMALGEERDGTYIGEKLNFVSTDLVAQNVIAQLKDGIHASELDDFAAKYCASLCKEDHEYAILGGRIAVSNHQKNNPHTFSQTVRWLYENVNPDTGKNNPLVHRKLYKFVQNNAAELEAMIATQRDFRLDYFGIETLKKAYLLRRQDNGHGGINVTETPQYLYMRVAIALSLGKKQPSMEFIKQTYDLLSQGFYSHASPTMFNAGTPHEQLSSCFLLGIGDSMVDEGGIPDCWKACAQISKVAGGIGIGIQPIRAQGTMIAGTGGKSDGIVPLSRVFNDIARYVNQGGRRPGSIKLSLEPWHPDLFDFLDLKKNIGIDELRSRDLTYALWVPDLFMKRLEQAIQTQKPVMWSFLCPHKCPGLYESYGEEFEALYEKYEKDGAYNSQVDVMHVWREILTSQKETGGPDILFKDSINRKSNQKNIGVIRNSNLCSEIVEYSDDKQYAVCNLASMSLVSFVREDGSYNFEQLMDACSIAHRNLDSVIDINFYPHIKCKWSNVHHRPVGLGTQAWADTLLEMGLSFEVTDDKGKANINPTAKELNQVIAECMYYACVNASVELAKERERGMKQLAAAYKSGTLIFKPDPRGLEGIEGHGIEVLSCPEELRSLVETLRPIEAELNRDSHFGSYSSFLGSPASEGKLQYHLWNVTPLTSTDNQFKVHLDWDELVSNVVKYGLRNSLLRADMPTASTAQILGNSECTEPYKYVLYTRRVTAGEFVVVNPYLHKELRDLGLWNKDTMNAIVRDRGTIQGIKEIPHQVRDKYRTAFEISKKTIQIMAADRGAFIDQTQSMNYFVPRPNNKLMTNILMGGWKMGLKTGMYYLRREPVENPVQFTVDKSKKTAVKEEPDECLACSA